MQWNSFKPERNIFLSFHSTHLTLWLENCLGTIGIEQLFKSDNMNQLFVDLAEMYHLQDSGYELHIPSFTFWRMSNITTSLNDILGGDT